MSNEPPIEHRARRAARRVGLVARKSVLSITSAGFSLSSPSPTSWWAGRAEMRAGGAYAHSTIAVTVIDEAEGLPPL
jgi:hypothetical protein